MAVDLTGAQRIMIYGFSSSGKSTLSIALGERLGLPVTHLDRLHFVPGTNWQPVPWETFVQRHDDIIAEDRWIVEGGYTKNMAARAERADVIIHMNMNRFACVYRFIRRYFRQKHGTEPRRGTPDGLEEEFNWDMVWWILEPRRLSPRRRKSYLLQKGLFRQYADKIVRLNSFREADDLVASITSPETGSG